MIRSVHSACDQINTVVFLVPRPVSAFEEEKWCFSYLRSQGLSVKVIDLTKVLNRRSDLIDSVINSVDQPIRGKFIYQVNSFQEFESLVKMFSGNSIFIDYLVGLSVISLREERVFRILKIQKARYAIISSGALPLAPQFPIHSNSRLGICWSKIVKFVSNPILIINFSISKIIITLTRQRLIYPLPEIIFGGVSEVVCRFVEKRALITKVIPINSSDFDATAELLRASGNKMPDEQNICVFLDEAVTHHSDFKMLNIEPADPEKYYCEMNRFFDFVEKETGLEVVVAAHPRANYESSDPFSGRRLIKGKTAELVSKSKLVVAHMSTALSFAVLFKKPVVSVKIPGLKAGSYLNSMVETMASAIGNIPVDLEQGVLTGSILHMQPDEKKYAEYERRYVKTLGAEELTCWEIFAKTIKSKNVTEISQSENMVFDVND
ncbi:MAG: hypothetical protein WCK63_05445 [Betaproteobacteria bacterium]